MRFFIPKEDSEGRALYQERTQVEEDIQRKQREISRLRLRRREIDKKLMDHVLVENNG